VVFELFRGGSERATEIADHIAEMLGDCRHTLEVAFEALFDGENARSLGKEVRKTDVRVNKAERAIRRELVVYASVRGATADISMILASMSVAKDAERIGDYAKNIWDLAAEGIDFADAPDRVMLEGWRHRVLDAVREVARVFGERDTEAAHDHIQTFDDLVDECDAVIREQIKSEGLARDAVARALLFRYIKRVIAHLMNILTSLVMPIDRLDYYDEKKADRE
jgi:phosphate uptake regulator